MANATFPVTYTLSPVTSPTMRLQILSDLHLEFHDDLRLDVAPGIDALIVAGDVCSGTARGFSYLRQQAGTNLPIVAVAGNHEFYGTTWQEERAAARDSARHYGITWLDDDTAEIGGVRFVGATLWTDYEVYGADRRLDAMDIAGRAMNDHRLISARNGDGARTSFSPAHARDAHHISRAYLDETLGHPFDGTTVVVTHHGPHADSIAPKFRDSLVTAAFVSDLSVLLAVHQPPLWIHGHTHVNFDYRVGATRVICNPYGYPGENIRFMPRLVVEV